jgi:hypothetical protein
MVRAVDVAGTRGVARKLVLKPIEPAAEQKKSVDDMMRAARGGDGHV